jgi:aerobic-type carbon monoxide dehydrogenase small subunit (CoxS/CutS family)
MKKTIRFTLNGTSTELEVEAERALLWVLRTDLGLTGTKYGCGEGLCGSCTVIVDGVAERSCRLPVGGVAGREVLTIEGLASGDDLHPLQAAFVEHDALQCGFCTPGMILSGYGLLRKIPDPSRQQIIDHMDDNLCRCGAHIRIVRAIEDASKRLKGRVRS